MRIIKTKDYEEMSRKAANIVASQMVLKPNSVLGLATGDTPLGMYKELIELYKKDHIDCRKINTFNLDEYYGLDVENSNSYAYYMRENFFKHINIKKENTNIPNGMTRDIQKECEDYEKRIEEAGGIDLQVLGIGRNGHIGFNEPDLKFEASTHIVHLDEDTIEANARFFDHVEDVPIKAISMGIKTIMGAKKIMLLASGKGKAESIYHTLKGEITPKVPASILQLHPDVIVIVDEEAVSKIECNLI